MANKMADKLDSSIVIGKEAEHFDGSYFTYQVNWAANKLIYYSSDCKYFNNPGFVCPLSAYRGSTFFFLNG
jgi:hypothetical protein